MRATIPKVLEYEYGVETIISNGVTKILHGYTTNRNKAYRMFEDASKDCEEGNRVVLLERPVFDYEVIEEFQL